MFYFTLNIFLFEGNHNLIGFNPLAVWWSGSYRIAILWLKSACYVGECLNYDDASLPPRVKKLPLNQTFKENIH